MHKPEELIDKVIAGAIIEGNDEKLELMFTDGTILVIKPTLRPHRVYPRFNSTELDMTLTLIP